MITYAGLNKGCLPQKVLQVEGSYKPGDIHPNIPDLVLIKNQRNRSYPQRWGNLKQYDEKKRKMREAEEEKRRARGVKPFSTTQTDQSITFKRLDPHPTIKGLFFIGYHFDKRINKRVETWKTKEQYYSMLERNRLYIQENKERRKQASKDYRIKNAKKIKERKALEYLILKGTRKFKDKRNAYNRKRRKEDECFNLRCLLHSRIRNAVKFQRGKKAFATMELIGCTVEHLRDHLESQFTEGMTWDNMGRGGWQMDHIIPCNVFDLTKPSHQKVCFNWQNIQPLWERDNILKDDKIHWSIVLTLMLNNYKTIGLN